MAGAFESTQRGHILTYEVFVVTNRAEECLVAQIDGTC